jgi:hypothetical protein
MQSALPATSEYKPASHTAHVAEIMAEAYWPGMHLLQLAP